MRPPAEGKTEVSIVADLIAKAEHALDEGDPSAEQYVRLAEAAVKWSASR